MLRYYITYAVIITGGTVFIILGFMQELPHIPCFIRKTTGIACPSCGITASIEHLFAGNVQAAFNAHPFGPVIAVTIPVIMTLAVYGLAARSRLEWLFCRCRIRYIVLSGIIVYILVWLLLI